MARLIPSFMDDATPPGERDVFNMLASGPHDWVAMHSLDLAPWNRGLRTEIDFVVVVPDSGILCLEIKSQDQIAFENDRWIPPSIKRSPFKQAADGSHAFYRGLKQLAPQFRGVPIVYCCIFPRAQFELRANLSVHPWELMDVRMFESFADGESFCADLKARMVKSIEADVNVRPLSQRLSPTQIEQLVECCLPVQKRRPDAREEIVRREQQIARILLAQQKPVLELASLNNRVVVSGGAGTGKTLIAIEVARRAAELGNRTALLCFNQLIGEWLRHQTKKIQPPKPNLIVGTVIGVMVELAGISIPANAPAEFWKVHLPEQIEDRLTNPEFTAVAAFDYLVLDEAQDVLSRAQLWHLLSGFLVGGISSGKFCMLGDFEHQVLSERETMEANLKTLDRLAQPAKWRLSENCRNYRIIGETAIQLAGLDPDVYSGYRRPGGGVQNYNVSFYSTERQQLDQLAQWLKDFRAQHYKPSEVTILSFRAADSSAAAKFAQEGGDVVPLRHDGRRTGYASVHAFKGLENKIIILTDVLLQDHDFQRDLFYTGLTRATEIVRVLCDARSRETLLHWIST